MRTIKELHILFREAVSDTFFIWRKEAGRVVRDQGVLIFFILVPVLYPLLYAFIYTGETVREVPAVVVDGANTALSRDFVRRVDASPDVKVVARTGNMEEAKELMRRTKAYGIIRIPDDFSRKVNRMQQAYVGLYCDMSGLLYYKALLTACTDVSLDMNTELQIKRMGNTFTPYNSIPPLVGFEALNTRATAVAKATSSEKLTCPLFRKYSTSFPAVTTDGSTGNIGLLHSSIFRCNTS